MTHQQILPLVSPNVPPANPPLLLSSSKGFELMRWITPGAFSAFGCGLHWSVAPLVRIPLRNLHLTPLDRPPALKCLGGSQGGKQGEQAWSQMDFSRSESAQLPREKI